MAMSLGGSAQRKAEMNVTPMIDVLLVLIIIFMVIMPSLSTGLPALVPQPPDQKTSAPADDIVISVVGDGTGRINQDTVALPELGDRFKAVFRNSTKHVTFVPGGIALDFQQIAPLISLSKS